MSAPSGGACYGNAAICAPTGFRAQIGRWCPGVAQIVCFVTSPFPQRHTAGARKKAAGMLPPLGVMQGQQGLHRRHKHPQAVAIRVGGGHGQAKVHLRGQMGHWAARRSRCDRRAAYGMTVMLIPPC